MLFFEAGAKDAGEIANIFGNQEIVPHEALHRLQSTMRSITQALGQFGLAVKAQAVFATVRNEMQMAAHRPKKIFALQESV